MVKTKSKEPVWKGPEVDGVTFSLLSRFLVCRERFRLLVVEGLKPKPSFSHRLEYGRMFHACSEAYGNRQNWKDVLQDYARQLVKKYKTQQPQVEHWYNICKVQFPQYIKYWEKHHDEPNRRVLLREQVFDAPYKLPSGRTARLRGKWDGVDLIGKGVYLLETKTKGDIVEEQLKRQLQSGFDLQTMLYTVALLKHWKDQVSNHTGISYPIKGVRYNVIRRPLAGGKDSIRQCKDETPDHFYTRLGGLIADHPDVYFMRWRVEISSADLGRFCQQCLDPILEQLCDWWDWVVMNHRDGTDPFYVCTAEDSYERHAYLIHASCHFRYPYGVYNVLLEGKETEVDEYINTGSTLGLERTKDLFQELNDNA